MLEYYGQDIGVILFRKHVIKYIMGMHSATELRPYLVKCTSSAEILELITSHIDRIQNHEAA